MQLRPWLASLGVLALGALAVQGAVPTRAAQPSAWNALAATRTAVVALPPDTSLSGFAPILSASTYTIYNSQTNLLMYVPLVFISGTDDIDFRHSLAESITANPSGTVYTVRLNPKWHWSNGTPVTSADVVYDARLLMAACQPGSKLAYGGCGFGGLPSRWKSVMASGPYTVVFTLKEPSNPMWFERNGLGQILPFPKAVWQKSKDPEKELAFINSVMDEPSNPVYRVVDGPFRFARAVTNEYWEFVPNPRYNGHKSQIRHLIFQYFASDTAEFAALLQGKVSVGYLTGVTLPSRGELHGYRFGPVYGFCFYYMSGNMSPKTPYIGATFRDLKVRQAIQMAIDQKAFIRIVNGGYGLPEASPVPPKPELHVYLPELLPKPYPFDPLAGRRLLEEDGWRLVHGVMTKHGVRLAFPFLYATGSVAYENFAALLKADLAEEGIQITPRAMPFNELAALANDTANPANASRWVMAWYGGWCYEPDYYPTGGGLFSPTGYANAGGFSDPGLTKLIEATYLPATPYEAKVRLTRYLARAARLLPVWYLPALPTLAVTADYLHGVLAHWDPVEAVNFPNEWTIQP